MAECSKPDCVEARRQRDVYRNAGPALVRAIMVAIARVATKPRANEFTPDMVVELIYRLLSEPRKRMKPEDLEVQNLAKIQIDALLNQGEPRG